MGRLLDEDDVVDWLLKRTEMYDATGHFVDKNVVKKNIESQIANIPSAQSETHDKRTEMHACDLIDRQALMKEFSDFVRASNNSDFAQTPTWNDAVSLVGSMPSAQPTMGQVFDGDTVSRQTAIDANTRAVER